MFNLSKTIKKSLLISILLLSGHLLSASSPANAQGLINDIQFQPQVGIPGSQFQTGGSVTLSKSTKSIGDYIQAIYNYGVGVVGILAAIILMIAGTIWITAQGNESKISEAREWVGAAFTGMALVLLSYVIFKIVNPNLVNLKIQNVTVISGQEVGTADTITNLKDAPSDIKYQFLCIRSDDTCGNTNPPSIDLDISLCREKYGAGDSCLDPNYPQKRCCGLSQIDKATQDTFCLIKDDGTNCRPSMTSELSTGFCLNHACSNCKSAGTSCTEDFECANEAKMCGNDSLGDCNSGTCSLPFAASENDACGADNTGKCLPYTGAFICPGVTQAVTGGTSCASGLKCCK
jgi:hypothetical protein